VTARLPSTGSAYLAGRCLPCLSVRGWHPLDGDHGDIVGEVLPDMA
jgi:hypothetical protein